MYYYHLTTVARLQTIKKEGLLPYNLSEHEGGIFLFTDILDCFEWASNFWCGLHREDCSDHRKRKVILRIYLPKKWKLYKDSDEGMRHYGKSLYSKDKIPSNFITTVYRLGRELKPVLYGKINYKMKVINIS
jgi:hypothetical protein